MNISATHYYSRKVTLQYLGRKEQVRLNTLMDINEVYHRVQTIFKLTCPFNLVYWDMGSIADLQTDLDLCNFLRYPRTKAIVEIRLVQENHIKQKINKVHEQTHSSQSKVHFQRSLRTSKWATTNSQEKIDRFPKDISEPANEIIQDPVMTPCPSSASDTQEASINLSVEVWKRSNTSSSRNKSFKEKMKLAAMVQEIITIYGGESSKDVIACDLLVDQILNETEIDLDILRTTMSRIRERKANGGQLLDISSP
ncbi:hypothetical protein DSO57_1033477 [Entomophthora muscae]|uniref:Uncharacterized protein n=1 Tax=Entomophthora muscae TaxID=34485 RepID=A0ACC2UK17_9FUNG|nr:hypothetical protein DSO57_1033477 [Entomophthora muscae]